VIDAYSEHASGIGARALEILRHPEVYPSLPAWQRSDVLLRLTKFEGLGEYWVWAVARRDGRYLLRRVIWDRPADHRPGAVDPTTFGSDANLPAELLDEQLAGLRSPVLAPFVRSDTIGIDGVKCGVEYGSYMASASLHWWSSAPDAWRPLVEWFRRCVDALEALLPTHVGAHGRCTSPRPVCIRNRRST